MEELIRAAVALLQNLNSLVDLTKESIREQRVLDALRRQKEEVREAKEAAREEIREAKEAAREAKEAAEDAAEEAERKKRLTP